MAPQFAVELAAFNLICTGQQTLSTANGGSFPKNVQTADFTEVYRIDLQKLRWCRDACIVTQPLASVDDTSITFENMRDETIHIGRTASVSRESGHYLYMEQMGSQFTVRDGECRRADFTGFPARKF